MWWPRSNTMAAARPSWSATPSATGSPACWRPIGPNWCALSPWSPPMWATRRARRPCARPSRPAPTPARPVAERLAALRYAFFAPGNDPQPWLAGWHPEVLAAQRIAGDRTPRSEDYAGGTAPILYLQSDHDPLAHVEDAHEFKRALGE